MTPRHQVSRTAIDLIKRFEGYRRKAAQLPDGRWTIGYGHTLTAREGAEVSETDAEALLLYDMIGVAHTVTQLTYASLTRNQFDALCAFAFSIGPEAFRSSDVLKRVNEGALTQAAFGLELWRKAEFEGQRIVIDAMVRRRAAEKLLFLTPPDDQWRAVPSAVLQPLLDETAVATAPRDTPVHVTTTLDGPSVALAREEIAREPGSPVTAAAETVTARLQALFRDADFGFEHEAEPDRQPPSPQGEPAVPKAGTSSEPAPEAAPEAAVDQAASEATTITPPAAPKPVEAEASAQPASVALEPVAPKPASADAVEEPRPRVIIDDTAPYEFVPPAVQPIDGESGDGLLAIVSLVILGLAFFAGGVFWALNARADVRPGVVFTPLLVGWLAGVAGVGFIAAAVFILLQRVTRAAERRDSRSR